MLEGRPGALGEGGLPTGPSATPSPPPSLLPRTPARFSGPRVRGRRCAALFPARGIRLGLGGCAQRAAAPWRPVRLEGCSRARAGPAGVSLPVCACGAAGRRRAVGGRDSCCGARRVRAGPCGENRAVSSLPPPHSLSLPPPSPSPSIYLPLARSLPLPAGPCSLPRACTLRPSALPSRVSVSVSASSPPHPVGHSSTSVEARPALPRRRAEDPHAERVATDTHAMAAGPPWRAASHGGGLTASRAPAAAAADSDGGSHSSRPARMARLIGPT